MPGLGGGIWLIDSGIVKGLASGTGASLAVMDAPRPGRALPLNAHGQGWPQRPPCVSANSSPAPSSQAPRQWRAGAVRAKQEVMSVRALGPQSSGLSALQPPSPARPGNTPPDTLTLQYFHLG
ncbi:hypothetical protein SKAU_G00212950 [Synaphobranchus kaupii]|uniref:Uncharacterized protein n=1 Tax=Synaphobranchus kaupii TaxID=118154 RepID=A0A9Q1F9P5_SYNKA|nr:hypothetical protein SKAU_G00212950 [Synaphobranchus kaupii]